MSDEYLAHLDDEHDEDVTPEQRALAYIMYAHLERAKVNLQMAEVLYRRLLEGGVDEQVR